MRIKTPRNGGDGARKMPSPRNVAATTASGFKQHSRFSNTQIYNRVTAMVSRDYISPFPDALICHILSFLPTKCPAATCFLSKRWTPLWLPVPILDFEDEEPSRRISIRSEDDIIGDAAADAEYYASFASRRISFLRFVHRAISKRDVTQSVKKFRLKTCHSEGIKLGAWVNAAIQRGIEHLELILTFGVKFPSDIVASRTLVVLKLSGCEINGVFTDCFPSLKVMHLNELYFMKHHYLMQLLSVCPNLEDLSVDGLIVFDYYTDNVGGFRSLNKLLSAVVLLITHYISFGCICSVNTLTLSMYEEFPEVTCTFLNLTSLKLRVDFFRVHAGNLYCPFIDVFKVLQAPAMPEASKSWNSLGGQFW